MATERSEREFQQDINAAIAGTEDEIFRDALDADLDDNDGNHSLEEMGEGLEGDVIDEDDIKVEDDVEPEEDEEEDSEDDESEDEEEEPEAAEEDEQPQQGKFEPKIPPARLRAEAERAREAEQRVAILEARLQDLTQRVNTPPPAPKPVVETPAKPDQFAEPEKWEEWVLARAEERAAARLDARLADRDRQQQEDNNRRVDESLSMAAKGERSFEFQAAYNRLTSLDPKDAQARSTVQRIYHAPDPAKALFDWWDENGAQEYREQIARQLGFTEQRSEQRRAPAREERQQPRHEFRKPMRSLNSASGSNSNRVADPEILDNSEDSVFRYATKR